LDCLSVYHVEMFERDFVKVGYEREGSAP